MTALAIGPPSGRRRSRRGRCRRFWIITATATCGSSAGANETNQAYGGTSSRPLCAVPVLPATSSRGSAAGLAVPLSTVATIISVSSAAVDADIACESSSGSVLLEHVELGRLHLVDEVGLHHRAAVGDAGRDHRHLQRRGARRSYWPMPDWRGLRLVHVLGERRLGLRREVVEVVAVEAERLGLLAHRLGADLDGQRGEGGVAGVLQRLGERDPVGAAVAALVVDQAALAAVCGSW